MTEAEKPLLPHTLLLLAFSLLACERAREGGRGGAVRGGFLMITSTLSNTFVKSIVALAST